MNITLKYEAWIEGNRRFPTAPMPAISAPIFITIAGKLKSNMRYKTNGG